MRKIAALAFLAGVVFVFAAPRTVVIEEFTRTSG
jgi:hypothetical protein